MRWSISFTYFIFTFLLSAGQGLSMLPSPSQDVSSVPTEILLGEPSSIVNHSVNIITGYYQENEVDIEVAGPHPLLYQRSYISRDFDGVDLGLSWSTNHLGQVNVGNVEDRISSIFIYGDFGTNSTYTGKVPINKAEMTTHVINPLALDKYVTNCPDFCFSSGSHIRNDRFFYKKRHPEAILDTGNGYLRHYQRRRSNDNLYLMDYEKQPNGCIFRYATDKNQRHITLENEKGDKLSSLKIDTTNKSMLSVTSSDGKWARYHLGKINRDSYYLTRVEGSNIPTQTYEYSTNIEHKKPKITRKNLPDNRFLCNEYYKVKDNQNGVDKVRLSHFDLRIDRVMLQKAPVGTDATPIITHRYFYDLRSEQSEYETIALGGHTTVLDAYNHKTDYFFNDDYRITEIYKWDEGNQNVYSIEKSFWGPNQSSNSTNLISRTLATGLNEVKLCRSYVYDDYGNAVKKCLWGHLTGRHIGDIILDPSGVPYSWSSECFVKSYTYATGPQKHLLSEDDGKKTIEFSYYPNTNLIASQLVKVDGKIRKREFIGYDVNGCPSAIFVDDGSDVHEWEHSFITERHLTFISNRTEAPIGLPKIIEQKYMDFDTREAVLKGKVCNQYSPMGKLISQEHYDSNHDLRYTLEWDYDAMGNVIMEKNALGQVIIKKYDLNKNLILEENPALGLFKEFTYDFANRLIRTTEVHPDGVRLTNTFRYDYLGNKIASVDPYGQEIRYVYDHQNRLIEAIFPTVLNEDGIPVQPITKMEYDLFNNPTCIIDAAGGKTVIAFTAYNKPYYKSYPDGTTERFEYDIYGNLILATGKNGTKTVYHYDAFDRVVKTEIYSAENTLIQTESNEYSTFHLLSKTDPAGITTRYEYNKAGKVVAVTKGDMRTEYQYDPLGRESKVLTFYGPGRDYCNIKVKEYDLLNRIIEEKNEDILGNILLSERYEYDLQGNRQVISKFNQAGESITKTEYNTRGQITSIINAKGEQTRVHYRYDYYDQALGQNLAYSETTDPKGIVTICIKDALGRNKSEFKKDSFGKLLQKRDFYYTSTDHLSRTVDAVMIDGEFQYEIINLYKYDAAGKLLETTESAGTPEQKITKFTYNAHGQKQSETKPDRTILYYSYDALGRLKDYQASDKTFHYVYEYDKSGNPIRVVDHASKTETLKSFDQYNRLIKETLANGLTIKYDYDLSGRPIKIQFPDGSGTTLTYENIHLKEVSRIDPLGKRLYTHTYDTYDLSGNVVESTLIKNIGKIGYEIDLNGHLKGISTEAWSSAIQNFDKLGNITKKTSRDKQGDYSSQYNYDELSQLIEENGHLREQYAWDSLYNRTKKGNCHYTLNHLNQVIHDGKSTYEYDLNGNLIRINNADAMIEFSYDALNRLVTAKKNSQLIRYAYDEMNRRIGKTVSELNDSSIQTRSFQYLYQGLNEVGCYENGTLTELRLLGIGKGAEIGAAVAMEFNNTVYAPIHDLHGNVVCLLDANTGNVKEFYRYTAFGEESLFNEDGNATQVAMNPWRFSSKRTDSETGYIYFGRRYYDSQLGRWITPDPIGFEGGPNLYAYAINNPLVNIDLYGLATESSATSSERSFFHTAKDFIGSVYEGIRDGIFNFTNAIGEGLALITASLCDIFSPNREERKVMFHQRILHSAMNRSPATRQSVGAGDSLGIFFANGINTPLKNLFSHIQMLSDMAGGSIIECIHNPSNGLIHDICRAFHSLYFNIASNVISEQHKKWDDYFEKNGTNCPILQICTSEGAINIRNSLKCYNPERRKMIDVLAIAPAAYIDRELCRNIYHYVSTRDFVPWFDLRGRMENQDTTVILPAHKDANFWDHDFQSPTYEKVIRDHIKYHLKNCRI